MLMFVYRESVQGNQLRKKKPIMSEGRYSFSLTTFSPSGKLVQIEHALTAVSQGITSIGIKGTHVVNSSQKEPMALLLQQRKKFPHFW